MARRGASSEIVRDLFDSLGHWAWAPAPPPKARPQGPWAHLRELDGDRRSPCGTRASFDASGPHAGALLCARAPLRRAPLRRAPLRACSLAARSFARQECHERHHRSTTTETAPQRTKRAYTRSRLLKRYVLGPRKIQPMRRRALSARCGPILG